MTTDTIRLGHGSGGLLTNRLLKNVIVRYFTNKTLKQLEDSAAVSVIKKQLAFTTDSYVVDPIFFPGGDIGMLALCGTVNDLAMKGAEPKFISFSLILEEGLRISDLETILKSAARTARMAGVEIVCGDTKVVERGKADKVFITTSGVGIIRMNLSKTRIRAGDEVLVSGTIGDHGIVIMNERLHLGLRSSIHSDAAPLNLLTRKLWRFARAIRFMRDPTRGGVASILNEMIDRTRFGIMINERSLPIKPAVRGACDILGVDPLYVANEGKFLAIVDKNAAHHIVRTLRQHPLGKDAAIIGEVVMKPKGVWLKTSIGGIHPLLLLEAEGLPRIC